MSSTIQGTDVVDAVRRASQTLIDQRDYLTSLDQAMGDGDMGITMGKIGEALLEYVDANPIDDIGKYLFQLGTATNKAAPSTMGTLTAGALMSAGKVVRDQTELQPSDLAAMFQAADEGIQTRGKAKLGDKTIVDALHPASAAFGRRSRAGRACRKPAQPHRPRPQPAGTVSRRCAARSAGPVGSASAPRAKSIPAAPCLFWCSRRLPADRDLGAPKHARKGGP